MLQDVYSSSILLLTAKTTHQGESEDEYRKAAGYLKTDEDEYEPETKYIRRMCGIIHLYAAIVVNSHGALVFDAVFD